MADSIRTWNRLEGNPRENNIDYSFAVRDPLWFLTRQWQMGELVGEDTGAMAFAQVSWMEADVLDPQQARQEQSSFPLEAIVESMPALPDYRQRMDLGRRWSRLIDQMADVSADRKQEIKNAYKNLLILQFKDIRPHTSEEKQRRAADAANRELWQLLAIAGKGLKLIDGVRLLEELTRNGAADLLRNNMLNLNAREKEQLNELGLHFKDWFEQHFYYPRPRQHYWQPERLEYQFDLQAPQLQDKHLVLKASEYYHGKLDWYALNLNGEKDGKTDGHYNHSGQVVIPAEMDFPGMPAARLWAFESGDTDLGSIRANITETAKMILPQFALLYNNDWFVIPMDIPVGSLTEIRQLVVTDVFGQRKILKHYADNTPADWNFMGLHNPGGESDGRKLFYMPDTVYDLLEGAPLEHVRFLRDEMANMVWAVEKTVSNKLGRGIDGYQAGLAVREYLRKTFSFPIVPTTEETEDQLRFQLMTQVAENWIPFVPQNATGQKRRLQRGAMPRVLNGLDPQRIRPRTALLQHNFDENTGLPKQPYTIQEEEIPRSGVDLKLSWQRTRWYNGQVVLWLGYRKQNGYGEGSSGLKSDQVIYKK